MTESTKCRLLFHVYLVEKAKTECPYCGLKLLTKEEYAR
jgi:DNA-directed RNA polymerase subunit RPC12/RpoP